MASPSPQSAPGRSRRILKLTLALAAVTAVAAAAYVLWSLSERTERLESALAEARERETSLEQKLEQTGVLAADLRRISQEERQRAEEALRAAREAEEARSLAEMERSEALEEADRQRLEAERRRREAERIRRARQRELDRVSDILGGIVETERTPTGLVMRLAEDSFEFDFDKAALRPRNKEILSRIAGVLLATHGYRLYVDGHTDSQGDARYNQQLSERRAKTVRDYLVEAGIPAGIIQSKGYGETRPRAPNTTKENRQKNRRVEIGLVDTVITYEKALEDSDGAAP